MAPDPKNSRPHLQHKIYPYLLRGVNVIRPKQVWSTDIPYVRLARGFVYLAAVIDWYSRKVLVWRLSDTLDSDFCVDCLDNHSGLTARRILSILTKGASSRTMPLPAS